MSKCQLEGSQFLHLACQGTRLAPWSVLHIAYDKCFYICDAVVVKSLCITFLIHKEQFELHAYALRTGE